jgi:radical SAM superfamily enzyme YgiQ (UPF0313 family)
MEFDVSVIGEGENAIQEIIKMKLAGHKDFPKIMDFGRVLDLDSLPIPDRSLIKDMNYEKRTTNIGNNIENVISSRGCSWGKCRFCNTQTTFPGKYVYRSPKKIIEEIRYLKEYENAEGVSFIEDIFTGNSARIIDLSKEFLKSENSDLHKMRFQAYTRVFPLLNEVLDALQAMNFQNLFVGFESGSDKTLEEINKGYSNKISMYTINNLNRRKFKYGAGFMIGFPNETEEDIQKTIEMASMKNHSYSYLQVYCGFPTSLIYQQCIKEGLVEETFGTIFSSRTHHVSRERLREIEENFSRNRYFPDEPEKLFGKG